MRSYPARRDGRTVTHGRRRSGSSAARIWAGRRWDLDGGVPMVTSQARTIDETKMMDLVNQAVGDMGGALVGALVMIGDKLGLYRALADNEPLTPAELAKT